MKRPMRILAALLTLALASPACAESGAIAERLTALGYLREGAANVSTAVSNFQTANALPATGTLDSATLSVLNGGEALSKGGYLRALSEKYDIMLANGSMGEEVRKLQERLSALGYLSGSADGVFGDATRRAVMAFQTANGLYATGEAGQAVLLRLYDGRPVAWADFLAGKQCVKGDSGTNVRSLQRRLRKMGYFDGECTASFGERTERAVELFQQENALEISGRADDATCALIYTGDAKVLRGDDMLSEGDTGEDVRELQLALNALGYFSEGVSGEFRESTLVAVTLFQIANGLEVTGRADAALLAAARADGAVPLSEATEALDASAADVNEETFALVAQVATDMLGKSFVAGSDELFPGFAFAQYAYARVGVALIDPGRIVQSPGGTPLEDGALMAGEIVALEYADDAGVRLQYALALDSGRIAYVDAGTGYVVCVELRTLDYDGAYVWNFGRR